MLSRSRQIRADRRRWGQAESLADLGNLMALWLEGELSLWPGYEPGAGPDEETAELIPVLAAANRAGFVTDGSQPGCVETIDGACWEQRAAVTGLIRDPQLLSRVRASCEGAGLTVMWFGPPNDLWWHSTPVTFRGFDVMTVFGVQLDEQDLKFVWRGIGPSAMAEVVDAWQVTIIDRCRGRNDLLWPALEAALTPVFPTP